MPLSLNCSEGVPPARRVAERLLPLMKAIASSVVSATPAASLCALAAPGKENRATVANAHDDRFLMMMGSKSISKNSCSSGRYMKLTMSQNCRNKNR